MAFLLEAQIIRQSIFNKKNIVILIIHSRKPIIMNTLYTPISYSRWRSTNFLNTLKRVDIGMLRLILRDAVIALWEQI